MTSNKNPHVNAGVQANIGMDFQKNCTIYLLLSKFAELDSKKYFITLEHIEDIIFGFLNENNELYKIETCQAKKSTSKWTIGSLIEIIQKITETSYHILSDPYPKTHDFFQENYFATNNTIELKVSINKVPYTETVNETNEQVSYCSLQQPIKDKILKGNNTTTFTSTNIGNLDTLIFKYVDMGRTPKAQLYQLNGMFVSVFEDTIKDHKAALYTLYYALEKIEREFNQGNIAKLNDQKKKINSNEINEIFDIFTKKKLAFDFWRDKGEEICEALDVSLFDVQFFKLHYQNSVDKFKDITESEHKRVLDFVNENKTIFRNSTRDKDCILKFVNEFNKRKSSTLRQLHLKAIIAAAYIEVKHNL